MLNHVKNPRWTVFSTFCHIVYICGKTVFLELSFPLLFLGPTTVRQQRESPGV